MAGTNTLPIENMQTRILNIRGHAVMLGFQLAELYQVETRVLNQAVSRNAERFPDDFMFQLSEKEFENLMSQIVISSEAQHGGRRKLPRAFTQEGIAMLSGVLRSGRAIEVNISIMRAFVQMRSYMMGYTELAEKLAKMESKYDKQFRVVFDALRALMEAPKERSSQNPIGYIWNTEKREKS